MPSPSDIGVAISSTIAGIGCESIDGDDDEDIDEDIEVEDVGESDDEDKEQEEGDVSEKQNISSRKIHDGGKENNSDDDIQVT